MGNTGLKMLEDALAADSELRDKYQEILDRVIAEGGAKNDGEVIQKVAAELGYEVPLEELERAWAGEQELDEAELDKVAGGWTDEHGHDTSCFVAWHCYTITCHTETIHKNVNCWSNYKCMFSDHVWGEED